MKYRPPLSTLLSLTAVLAASVGSYSSAIAALAPETGVRLYTETNYTGRTLQFPPNTTHSVTLQPKDQDQISSIEVPVGFKATLVDNDGNRPQSQTFRAGKHRSICEKMNNKADAVIVSRDLLQSKSSGIITDFSSFLVLSV